MQTLKVFDMLVGSGQTDAHIARAPCCCKAMSNWQCEERLDSLHLEAGRQIDRMHVLPAHEHGGKQRNLSGVQQLDIRNVQHTRVARKLQKEEVFLGAARTVKSSTQDPKTIRLQPCERHAAPEKFASLHEH